jgi:hypothetical protein
MKFIKILMALICLSLFLQPIYGLNFNSSGTLPKGDLDLAIGTYISSGLDKDSPYFGFLLMNDYGLFDSLDTVVKAGYIIDAAYSYTEKTNFSFDRKKEGMPYAGLEFKILLADRFGGTDKWSMNIGGHFTKNVGIDISMTLGSTFFKFDNYIGLDFDIELIENQAKKIIYPGNFIFGAKFAPFSNKKNYICLEGGIPVTSYGSYQLGTAYRMTF